MVAEDGVFDFWGILVNEIIGDVWISTFLFLMAVIFMTIKFKMPFEMQILFSVLMLAAIFSKTLIIIIWVFIILFVGVLFYWFAAKGIGG